MTDENQEQENLIKKTKLEGLFNDLLGPVAVGSLVAMFFTYHLKDNLEHSIIYTWCFLIILGGMLRVFIKFLYQKSPGKYSVDRWQTLYVIATIFVATVWASIPILIIDKVPVEKDVFIVTILLGLASGGAISHISSKFTAFYYCSSVVLAHMIKTFVEDRPDAILLIAGEALFVYLILEMVNKFNDINDKSHRLAIELSEKMNLEHDLQKEKVKALQNSKLASLGEMAAGIAHEINNPLAISMGKMQVILKSIEKAQRPIDFYTKQLNEVLESNRRVADIVQGMRNLSRIKEEIEFTEFTIKELLELTTPLLSIKLKTTQVRIIQDFDDYKILADKSELGQVLLNLLNNSIDAIKDSPGDLWVKIDSALVGDNIEIRVTDSGLLEGIKDKFKIFEPFFTSKEIGEGTGLGLSLSRGIMERNNGKLSIDLDSKNTCFIITVKAGN
jgi:signal transduction histidine kinase